MSATVGHPTTNIAPGSKRRRFLLILIKPSHYDDDGYVVQWARSIMPSNSLAVLYGLAKDAARRQVLGPDVGVKVVAIDETNTRVRPSKIISEFARNGGFGMVGLVGVQSNQFPRALDIARPLRKAGIPVAIGGFHVSGCLAMLSGLQRDLQMALDMGVSLFAGEAEGRMDSLLVDAAQNRLAPIYNYLKDLPDIMGAPIPYLMRDHVSRTMDFYSAFDAGRGCPYQCSFCTIINVQGRKSRSRSADDLERIIRQNLAEGICSFFITDDNFSRNTHWEALLDRIIQLREEEDLRVFLTIQVDTLCHKIPNFVDKAARAGVVRVFIGIDSINPDTLATTKKRQNKITEYRKLLLAWKNAGVLIYADYILGFPNDTPESIRRDVEIIKEELPLDMMVFYCLTPLPGSEDHQVLWRDGVWMDADMNKYDTEHAVTAHPKMSEAEWVQAYRDAWNAYYTPEHCEVVLRRAAAARIDPTLIGGTLMYFSRFMDVEKIHPLQGGVFRLKYRTDRRPGLPIEPFWSFYPKYGWEIVAKLVRWANSAMHFRQIQRTISKDPNAAAYSDPAMTLATDTESENFKLFTHTQAAREAVEHIRKVEALTRTG